MIETKLKIYKRHHFWTFIKHIFGGTIYMEGNTKQYSLKEKKTVKQLEQIYILWT